MTGGPTQEGPSTPVTTPVTALPPGPSASSPAPSTADPVTGAPAPTIDPNAGPSVLGMGVMGGMGQSTDRWQSADVTRDGSNYKFMANGWGPGFTSQSVSWNGTSFTVVDLEGEQGENYEPCSYPTVFCGQYSKTSGACGLPAEIASLTSLRTGWMWAANGNDGEYNAAYDIWLGDGGRFTGFFMVWLRDPPGQQPAGSLQEQGVSVANVPGTWDIWSGMVNNHPITNYVRPEGQDSPSLEFDILDFLKDAAAHDESVPGTQVLAVAVGFEMWNGPFKNLQVVDFYVDPE